MQWGSHLSQGAFAGSQVNSIYLDTLNRDVISRSLEKPLYKEKLRIRWYGEEPFDEAKTAFVELKKKYKGVVYKRRVKASPKAACRFASEWRADRLAGLLGESQIARELEAARVRAERLGEIAPSVLISCKRSAFGTDDEGGLRVTFDEGLQARDLMAGAGNGCVSRAMGFHGTHATSAGASAENGVGSAGAKAEDGAGSAHAYAHSAFGATTSKPVDLLPAGWAIMEVKCEGSYPLWLVRALDECGAYPTSFSKYGEFYKGLMSPARR